MTKEHGGLHQKQEQSIPHCRTDKAGPIALRGVAATSGSDLQRVSQAPPNPFHYRSDPELSAPFFTQI
jgi:hypothetical protein